MEASFGPAIRSERLRLGQSLGEFADFLGTSVSTLKRWEAGQVAPTEAQREALFDLIHGAQRSEPELDGIHYGWMLKIERFAALTSIRRAAEQTLIPASAWHRYETGQSRVGRNQVKKLIQKLGGPVVEPAESLSLEQLQALAANEPLTAARTLVNLLLEAEHGRWTPPLTRFEASRTLALSLMHIGEHHLCGQAYRIAARYGAEEGIPEEEITATQISSGWRGFPEVTNRMAAANRLRWMEKKIVTLPEDRQAEFATMRSMFIDWAGYPHLAADVLRHANHDDLQELSLAWIECKYGSPERAITLADEFLDHDNAKNRFIANKVVLEAYMKLDDLEKAKTPMENLLELRATLGFWSPDLTTRSKKILRSP
ncbi:MAG: helix-turn-helix domain-containing protein [Chthonomonas sp.]|nr:helix-turn-helix domain-containing protein [Chthonomonas sp.]